MKEVGINFKGSCSIGNAAEEALRDVLSKYGYTHPVIMVGYFKDYDIKTDGGTFEIKNDVSSKGTGNFFIELMYNGNPSGIKSTLADYFVIVDMGDRKAYVAPTPRVKEFLTQNRQFLQIKIGGDDGKSTGVIVPIGSYTPSHICGLQVWDV